MWKEQGRWRVFATSLVRRSTSEEEGGKSKCFSQRREIKNSRFLPKGQKAETKAVYQVAPKLDPAKAQPEENGYGSTGDANFCW